MTKCEITPQHLPTTIETSALQLRLAPPMLTAEALRQMAETLGRGDLLFLDEMFNGIKLP